MQYVAAVALFLVVACGDNQPGATPASRCGDGVVDPGEHCDDGNDVDDDGCHRDCRLPACGDGVLDTTAGERCDDGNVASADGCTADCTSDETCGNGIVDAHVGEQCDDGVAGLSSDGCSSTCAVETAGWQDRSRNHRMPDRHGAAIAYDAARQQLIMFGGYTTQAEADTRVWNGSTWALLDPVTSPPARLAHTLTYDRVRQRVVLFGGADGGAGMLDDLWEWDGTTWTQRAPTVRPPARAAHGTAFDENRGVLVLFGGRDADGVRFGDTWEWNGSTWQQVTASGAPSPRSGFAMAFAGAQGVLVAGSDTAQATSGAGLYTWNGQTWTSWPLAMSYYPGDAMANAAAFDRTRSRVVIASRNSGPWGSAVMELSEWTGTEWVRVMPPERPTQRDGGIAMAFDEGRGATVLFGGVGHGDTWFADDMGWAEATGGEPPGRYNASVTYDQRRHRVVMFGGLGNGAVALDDTWEWDGVGWQRKAPARSPRGRYAAGFAYDSRSGRALLFGGLSPVYTYDPPHQLNVVHEVLGDTWEWDGTGWTERTPATSPPSGLALRMTYDQHRARFVAVNLEARETWEWDGMTWERRTSATAPPVASVGSIAYDERRQRTVLLTGNEETWEWDGTSWARRATQQPAGGFVRALAYDTQRARVIAQIYRVPNMLETWAWDGTMWTQLEVAPAYPHAGHGAVVFDGARAELLSFGGSEVAAPGEPLFETWTLATRAPGDRETCVDGADADGDGLESCDDPDCWAICTPTCPPQTSCDPTAPRCGDGACAPIESAATCPADC